jgi:hypothetical protein
MNLNGYVFLNMMFSKENHDIVYHLQKVIMGFLLLEKMIKI